MMGRGGRSWGGKEGHWVQIWGEGRREEEDDDDDDDMMKRDFGAVVLYRNTHPKKKKI